MRNFPDLLSKERCDKEDAPSNVEDGLPKKLSKFYALKSMEDQN